MENLNGLMPCDWEVVQEMLVTGKTNRLSLEYPWGDVRRAMNIMRGKDPKAPLDFTRDTFLHVYQGNLHIPLFSGYTAPHKAWGIRTEMVHLKFVGPEGLNWYAKGSMNTGYFKAARHAGQSFHALYDGLFSWVHAFDDPEMPAVTHAARALNTWVRYG